MSETPSNSSGELVRDGGSFRDPSGFIFYRDGAVFRQVNSVYREHYDRLRDSGLYESLAGEGLLLPHEELVPEGALPPGAYKILKPEMVPFFSYPYEWCFSQLRAAALATLSIQKKALDKGLALKDASAYNIQFVRGKATLIDTLSFEKYREGEPWVAYRQFCQHFLAPLALMSLRDIRLGQLSRLYIDGAPLDLTDALLPWTAWLNVGLALHLRLHARNQSRLADGAATAKRGRVSLQGLRGLLDSLEGSVRGLTWAPRGTEWADYYEATNYSEAGQDAKRRLVSEYLDLARPGTVWDLGANRGVFSRLASARGIETLSFDIDPAAVEKNYLEVVRSGDRKLLPLLLDLTNPSPGLGWDNEERRSWRDRGPADAAMALALIHHLAISNNLPFSKVADLLSRIAHYLIIEFVPKSDSQVKRLLASREDVFPNYHEAGFEAEFLRTFSIERSSRIEGSERTLYLMRSKVLPAA